MFSGIVEDVGLVLGAHRGQADLHLQLQTALASRLKIGHSLAVDGVCLTVTKKRKKAVCVTAVAETLARSTIGELKKGGRVNLETALKLGEPVGGHLVQGHVDGVGTVHTIDARGESTEMAIEVPDSLLPYVIEKGSIAIDGVSLTIASLCDSHVRVALVPHTLTHTTLGKRRKGDRVNLEVDLVAKYVERMLKARSEKPKSGITLQFLKEHGFA